MQSSRGVVAGVMLSLTAACSNLTPAVAGGSQNSSSVTDAQPKHAAQRPTRLDMECDGHRFALIGEGEAARVERNDATRSLTLAKPEGMADYVPVGMGCARSFGNNDYLVVAYGEPLVGCNICEWFFVYDRQGRPLNDSVPPMLDENGTLQPNNQSYTQIASQLGLPPHQIQYAPRAKPLDVPDRTP